MSRLGSSISSGSWRDRVPIFTNTTGQNVRVNKAIVYGTVDTVSTAVLIPVVLGTVNEAALDRSGRQYFHSPCKY